MDDQITEERINHLKKIGLNEYEARAYIALVGLREATAREILEAGGIPQGRIYDVLKDLSRKGYVEIQEGSPAYYRAVDPSNVIQCLGREYTRLLRQSMDTLKNLHIETPAPYPVWVISNESAIVNRIFALFKTVENELIVYSNNPEFFRQFAEELMRFKKHTRLYIIVDDPDRFPFRGLEFRKASEDFFSIMGDFELDGVVYRNLFSVIVDGKESFDVMTINNKQIGVMTRLPVLSYVIRRWLSHLHMLDDDTV
ncbi:MAG TPA: TrmB family transcriptional regulator [Methanoregula sp.]|nr:TrmB family transcriptional regulator [Methanoregula sp.]